jgi:catechol 2,3-dioxygenase-like lactoylglutathione lyase family enzyme
VIVERTDFVSVPVTDLERSTTWYREFRLGENAFLYLVDPTNLGQEFHGPHTAPIALRVPDVAQARAELEARDVTFLGETFDSGVCHMALFSDPDGNVLMLHRRYAPKE